MPGSQTRTPVAGYRGRVYASVSRAVLLRTEDGLFIFTPTLKAARASLPNQAPYAFPLVFAQRQVLVAGLVERVDDVRAEEYFKSRPYFSRLGAWASRQSALWTRGKPWSTLSDTGRNTGKIRLPLHWGGFALSPESVEFWQGGSHRLHDRFLYERPIRTGGIYRLYP